MRRVMQRLALRREENEREEARRRREAIAKCPEIGRVMKSRADAVMQSVASAFTLPPPADLENKVAAWNARIQALLTQNGFPADYLDPVFACAQCRDTGYVGEGKKRLCACAQALSAQEMEREGAFEGEQTFERYDETVFPDTPLPGANVTQRQYMAVLRARCEEFADALPAPKQRTVLMYGGSGLGKTFLLRSVLARARQRGVPALCVTANAFLKTAREAYFGRSGQDALDAYYETPLLLLDDLGTEPLIENITVEQLFNLINERQNARLCTVISTNLSLEEIGKRYTERVLSRLADRRAGLVLRFLGADIRLKA